VKLSNSYYLSNQRTQTTSIIVCLCFLTGAGQGLVSAAHPDATPQLLVGRAPLRRGAGGGAAAVQARPPLDRAGHDRPAAREEAAGARPVRLGDRLRRLQAALPQESGAQGGQEWR